MITVELTVLALLTKRRVAYGEKAMGAAIADLGRILESFGPPMIEIRRLIESLDEEIDSLGSCPTLDLAAFAKRMYAARRARNAILPGSMVGEPAYDMLLDAFISRSEARRVSVSSLCTASHAPATTALRWLNLLEEAELIERNSDPQDGRRSIVTLTDLGNALVSRALHAEQAALYQGFGLR